MRVAIAEKGFKVKGQGYSEAKYTFPAEGYPLWPSVIAVMCLPISCVTSMVLSYRILVGCLSGKGIKGCCCCCC